MNRKKRSLEEDVFEAFGRACREQDLEVADYLLHALEAIARRNNRFPRHQAARRLA